jgi:hypothetical protein
MLQDVLDLLLLAAVGNFVASPMDPNISLQSSMRAMPSVVIDTYTGELVMHTPYDAVRGYFVEALLVISIIVISRLTFVRNNTYNTTVQLLPAVSSSSSSSSAPLAHSAMGAAQHAQNAPTTTTAMVAPVMAMVSSSLKPITTTNRQAADAAQAPARPRHCGGSGVTVVGSSAPSHQWRQPHRDCDCSPASRSGNSSDKKTE